VIISPLTRTEELKVGYSCKRLMAASPRGSPNERECRREMAVIALHKIRFSVSYPESLGGKLDITPALLMFGGAHTAADAHGPEARHREVN